MNNTNSFKSRRKRRFVIPILSLLTLVVFISVSFGGCAALESTIQDIKGSLIGDNYKITFYDNYGSLFLTMTGDKIDIDGNKVEETGYDSDGSIITNYTLSSVIDIIIDGNEMQSCGDTVVFAGDGLTPEVNFDLSDGINSSSNGVTDITSISKVVNDYRNVFGKSRIVIIQSQLGVPICAFSGDSVTWKIPSDLPKTTKLLIDGKPLYIHRANFQIIDKVMIKE